MSRGFENNTSCGSWSPMSNLFYRKFEVYSMCWDPDTDVSKYIIAGASCGGPIAIVRDSKKLVAVGDQQLRTTIKIFTLSGKDLSETVWKYGRIAGIGWLDNGTLLSIADNGDIHLFSPLARSLGVFSLSSVLKSGENIEECQFWGKGVACLTSQFGVVCAIFSSTSASETSSTSIVGADSDFWGNESLIQPIIIRLADTNLMSLPSCWVIIPPEIEIQEHSASAQQSQSQVQMSPLAILGTISGNIVVVDSNERVEREEKRGPISRMCLSASKNDGNRMIAIFAAPFVWVLSANLTQSLAQFDTQSTEPPEQMAWCGYDSVVLYWDKLVLVIGPHAEWIKYGYDQPLHLITECDGLRIITNDSCEFLERVPEVTEKIFTIGSLDPSAMLFNALDHFDAKSPKADENIRAIRESLSNAVDSCIDGAAIEFGYSIQRKLLRAASLGKSFIDGYKPEKFVTMCKTIRLLNQVRAFEIGIPLTYSQFAKLTIEGLISRLASFDMHLLALRICESMGIKQHRTLTHWACQKVRNAQQGEDTITFNQITSALRNRGSIPYARIAAAAFKAGHTELATRLIENEPRSSEQVPLLQTMGLRELALDKAIESGDTDLAYGVILDLINSSPAGTTGWFDVIHSRPEAVGLLLAYLKQNDLSLLKRVLVTLESHSSMALLLTREAYQEKEFEKMVQILKEVQQTFMQTPSFALQAKFTEEQLRLLFAQRELELTTGEPLFGLSVSATISRLLSANDQKSANKIRSDFKVSDKKWWWLRLQAISANPDALSKFGQLEKLAREKKSPIGYEPFVEVCIANKVFEEAMKYILMIPEVGKRVPFLIITGKFHEAADAAFKAKEPTLLQSVIESCRSEADRSYAESLLLQITRK